MLEEGYDILQNHIVAFVLDEDKERRLANETSSIEPSSQSPNEANDSYQPDIQPTASGVEEKGSLCLEASSVFESKKPVKSQVNVFHRRGRQGEKEFFLYLREPIEKGQTVDLRFLSTEPPTKEDEKEFDIDRRHWIQDRISQLSLVELRSLLDYVNDEVGTSIYRKVREMAMASTETTETTENSDMLVGKPIEATKTAISRRRMHWIGLRINEQLVKALHQSAGNNLNVIMPSVAVAPLWTNDVVRNLRKHPDWKASILAPLMQEAGREILAEFNSSEFSDFASTRNIWCPMAERLFRNTVDKFAGFTTELGYYCSEERLISDICDLVAKAVFRVMSLADEQGPVEASKYADLVLTYKKGTVHFSYLFPLMDDVLATSTSQLYVDAMSLCDEPAWKPPARDDLRVVATRRTNQETTDGARQEESAVVLQSIEEMKEDNSRLDKNWYIERQILAVVEAVASCAVAQIPKYTGYPGISDVNTKLRDAVRKAIDDQSFEAVCMESRVKSLRTVEIPKVLRSKSQGPDYYHPKSQQFFLGLIWPVLRRIGWRLEVGDLPYDVLYLPPGSKKTSDSKHSKIVKQERAQWRNKLAKQTNALGLGYVPKQSKRLFAATAAMDGGMKMDEGAGISVKSALERFLFSFQASLDDDEESRNKAREIVDQLSTCFDDLAPRLLYKEEKDHFEVAVGQRLCEVYGSEYLMRLLLVMPSMLKQSDLSMQQVDDTLGVIRELTDFLAVNHREFFDESFHIPQEFYIGEPVVQPFLVPRLLRNKNSNSSKSPSSDEDEDPQNPIASDDLKELIQSRDRGSLTDFIEAVLDQVVVCRANAEDVARKNRRITLGFPGLVCRHCLGISGEGKYFFSTLESLTTAATVVEKHIAKCPKIPTAIKQHMVKSRTYHHDQRRNMPAGSQAAFFSRLWDRLRHSKSAAGAEADMYVNLSYAPRRAVVAEDLTAGTSSPSSNNEFKNHIWLLEHLKHSAPWKEKRELQEAIGQYYDCLNFGGCIYETNAMPPRFSSEWLLSKVAPKGKVVNHVVTIN